MTCFKILLVASLGSIALAHGADQRIAPAVVDRDAKMARDPRLARWSIKEIDLDEKEYKAATQQLEAWVRNSTPFFPPAGDFDTIERRIQILWHINKKLLDSSSYNTAELQHRLRIINQAVHESVREKWWQLHYIPLLNGCRESWAYLNHFNIKKP